MEKVLLSLSGGYASTTLCYYLSKQGYEIVPVYIMYGASHMRTETFSVDKVVKKAQKDGIIIENPLKISYNLHNLYRKTDSSYRSVTHLSPIISKSSPEKAKKSTQPPFRNIHLLTLLAGMGQIKNIYTVANASTDNKSFFTLMEQTINSYSNETYKILTPFTDMTKGEIVKWGSENKVPYELTWSCYKGRSYSCTKCKGCKDRIQAFREAKVKDPLRYFKF